VSWFLIGFLVSGGLLAGDGRVTLDEVVAGLPRSYLSEQECLAAARSPGVAARLHQHGEVAMICVPGYIVPGRPVGNRLD
jgi:hypothetical protein